MNLGKSCEGFKDGNKTARHLQQNVSRDRSQAFNCLQPHLFDLVVEHVNQEVESNHCELLISDGEFGESFHTGGSHRQALVLQAVDKSTTGAEGNQVNLQGESPGEAVKGRLKDLLCL